MKKKAASFTALVLSVLLVFGMLPATCAFADAKSDLDTANQKAAAANKAYERALVAKNKVEKKIKKQDAKLAELEEVALPAAKEKYDDAVRQLYVGGADILQVIAAILSGKSFSEVMSILNSLDAIASWRQDAVVSLKETRDEIQQIKASLSKEKTEKAKALRAAKKKKKAALDAQEKARKAYQDTLPQNVPSTTARAATATSFHDEASARAFIVNKESGGSYTARNGIYYGAYQLTSSYLHGDYSPANQDRVAERYVKNRYGSWMNAARFWVSHNWY